MYKLHHSKLFNQGFHTHTHFHSIKDNNNKKAKIKIYKNASITLMTFVSISGRESASSLTLRRRATFHYARFFNVSDNNLFLCAKNTTDINAISRGMSRMSMRKLFWWTLNFRVILVLKKWEKSNKSVRCIIILNLLKIVIVLTFGPLSFVFLLSESEARKRTDKGKQWKLIQY